MTTLHKLLVYREHEVSQVMFMQSSEFLNHSFILLDIRVWLLQSFSIFKDNFLYNSTYYQEIMDQSCSKFLRLGSVNYHNQDDIFRTQSLNIKKLSEAENLNNVQLPSMCIEYYNVINIVIQFTRRKNYLQFLFYMQIIE